MVTRRVRDRLGVGISLLWSCSLVAVVGCTTILGIDGDYVRVSDNTASLSSGATANVDARVPPAGESGGTAGSTGGAEPGFAGGAGTSGASVTGAGGIPALSSGGAGGVGVSPPPTGGAPAVLTACTPGSYSGKISGVHSASLAVGAPIPVTGTVTFKLVPDGSGATATVLDGKIDGSANLMNIGIGGSLAPFTGTLTGSVDCATDSMTGAIDGSFTVGPAAIQFSGTHNGSFAGGAYSGNWDETEVGSTTGQFGGKGTWDAARTGP